MGVLGCVMEGVGVGAKVARSTADWLVDGPKNVLANVDATSDLLKLVQRVNDIAKFVVEILPLQCIARAFSHITDAINARNIVGRLSDIVSGKAAWTNPFSENFPDLLKVMSKIAYTFGDIASTTKWLSSIGVLGSWVKDTTAQMVSWGNEFNLLKGIGDVSCITGALLNIADTVRLAVKECMGERYIRNGVFSLNLMLDHVLDIAYDVTKVAACILSNIPGVHILFTFVSLAVGSTLSLGKFFKKTYWGEPLPPPPPGGAAGANPAAAGPAERAADAPEEVEEALPADFDEVVEADLGAQAAQQLVQQPVAQNDHQEEA